jgi:hypothetical protein
MVTLRQARRAAEREELLRKLGDGLRRTFDDIAEEPVPERLRVLLAKLQERPDGD